MTYHVDTRFVFDVCRSAPGEPNEAEAVRLEPALLSYKWTRNNHHEADILTVEVGYKECGIDPRFLKNGRCRFLTWDGNRDELTSANEEEFTRFTGICKTAERKISNGSRVVELTFHDYTTLFLAMKPLKPAGIPEWTDTLREAWFKICDNTGWEDPANGKIVSTVAALRDRIVFIPEDLRWRTVGEMTSARFLKVAKPTPPQRADAWATWRWFCESLGLITYILKDQCFVTNTNSFYQVQENAPVAIYGENIWDFEEKADATITQKGILLKSFDPLVGRMIEAFYPPPGDPRIKTRRSAVGKKSEDGAAITANEVSGQYDEFEMNSITDQKALDAKAQAAFEERSRQELKGKFKTAEMTFPGLEGSDDSSRVDIMSLKAGDEIVIRVDQFNEQTLIHLPDEDSRVAYLVDVCDYDRKLAQLIARNTTEWEILAPVFHISSISVDYAEGKYEVEIEFHNVVITP